MPQVSQATIDAVNANGIAYTINGDSEQILEITVPGAISIEFTEGGPYTALLIGPGGDGGTAFYSAGGPGAGGDVVPVSGSVSAGDTLLGEVGALGSRADRVSNSLATIGTQTKFNGGVALPGGWGGSTFNAESVVVQEANEGGGGGGIDSLYGTGEGALHSSGFQGGDGAISEPGDDDRRASGGARGAGGNGANAESLTISNGGNGGPGIISDITGVSTEYGRGGGGSCFSDLGTPGTPNGVVGDVPGVDGLNFGDGASGAAGGKASSADPSQNGGKGGSGAIILRFALPTSTTVSAGDEVQYTYTVTDTAGNSRSWTPASVTAQAVASGPIEFGALTAVGAGATAIAEADGPYGEFSVSGGQITPNTSPLTVGQVTVGSTTINVVADVQTILPVQSEIGPSVVSAAAPKTVKIRDGVFPATGRGFPFDGRNPASVITLTPENPGQVVFSGATYVEDCSNLTFDGIIFENGGGDLFLQYGSNSDITVQNCTLRSTSPIDPNGDYTASRPTAANGITHNTGPIHNATYINNTIHDCSLGITATLCTGDLVISGNHIYNVYEDCVKVTAGPSTTTLTDNYLEGVIANGNDFDNPHADFIQFIGSGGVLWDNILIARNVLVAKYATAAAQGIFLKNTGNDSPFRAEIIGNLILQRGNDAGITVWPQDGCLIQGNTVLSNPDLSAYGTPDIRITAIAGHEPVTIRDNAHSGIVYDESSQPEFVTISRTETNNYQVPASLSGYQAAFAGPISQVSTWSEALARFAMKANGPLDADNSGGPSIGDIGAVGTGLVTFATTNPGNDGTTNQAYLPSDTVVYDAYDFSGAALTEVDLTQMRVSIDGGATYDTLTNLGLTATVASGEIVITGAMGATTTTPLVTYEQAGVEPYDALDNSTLSAVEARKTATPTPAISLLEGFFLAPTKYQEPV